MIWVVTFLQTQNMHDANMYHLFRKSRGIPRLGQGRLNLFMLDERSDQVSEVKISGIQSVEALKSHRNISILCAVGRENLRKATPCFMAVGEQHE